MRVTVINLDDNAAAAGVVEDTVGCHGPDGEGGIARMPCSGRGTCVPGIGERGLGACRCESGWFGDACEQTQCRGVQTTVGVPHMEP